MINKNLTLQRKFINVKVKRAIICLLLSFFSLVSIIPKSLANPVGIGPDIPDIQYLFLIFFLNLIIEYVIIFLFLTKHIHFPSKLFQSVFLVNLFTFPVTQIIALNILVFFPSAFGLHFIAELFPLIVEPFLYISINKIADRNNELKKPIPARKTVFYTITANLITFSIGLMILITIIDTYY